MKDRYQETFASLRRENKKAFCAFAVLGDPNPEECLQRIQEMLKAKPDILELGIPFSDPVADGPVIQAADERALKSGTTPKSALQLLSKIRLQTEVPIGLLVYANTVFKYGIDRFYSDAKKAGADSILIADVPLEEIQPFADSAKTHQIHQVMMLSENTSTERLKQLERVGSGFFYVVSQMGVTGDRQGLNPKVAELLARFKSSTKIPLLLGFGISTSDHIRTLKNAPVDGLIVGSALVKTPTHELFETLNELIHA